MPHRSTSFSYLGALLAASSIAACSGSEDPDQGNEMLTGTGGFHTGGVGTSPAGFGNSSGGFSAAGAFPGSGGFRPGGTGGGANPGSGGSGPPLGSGGTMFGNGGMPPQGAGGGITPGDGGAAGSEGGAAGSPPSSGGSAGAPPTGDRFPECQALGTLPAATDYGARGPFQVQRVNATGPSNQYTMFRPAQFGDGLHPPVSWGNGVATTPDLYIPLLETVASHGFVVIASNSVTMTAQLVRQGLEWLIAQNGSTFDNKLAVDCGAVIGYSMGGGSAVGAGSHPAVKAVVSLHGLTGPAGQVSGPLLLINSTSDGFVSKAQFTVPTYNQSSRQPTIMATLDNGPNAGFAGHLVPLGDAGPERAPLVAWLRMWLYGDTGAKPWFYGSSCTVCKAPWIDVQKKNHDWD